MSFALDPGVLRDALERHGRVARVVVAAVRGSAPRGPGASMLVWPGGQSGTVGGGALEWTAASDARALLKAGGAPEARRRPLGPGLGQCCGGSVTLVTEVLDAVPTGPVRALRVGAARAVPDVAPEAPGWRDGWLVERVGPAAPPLWIWGTGHVGRAIASVLAPLGAHALTAIDLPEKLAAGGALPCAALPCADLPALAARAPLEAAHLILTHDHGIDLALCDALLRRGFASCGLIGSATKRARFDSRLRAMGHAAPFARIDCPIGDPGLGKHPQAIAVGVAAALLAAPSRAAMRA